MTLVISGFLLPANEACEGNVFTGLSAHRAISGQGGSLSGGGSLSRGVSVSGVTVQRGLCSAGGSLPRGPLSGESLFSGDLCRGDPRTVKSRRYASYWNAFLFFTFFSNSHRLF